jgi:hypothetical protein
MKISGSNQQASAGGQRSRFYRFSTALVAALVIGGCSAQPMTLDQEFVATGVAGAVGAGLGAAFAASSGKSYPVSILIGAGGIAGIVLIYEEIKREAALENQTNVGPGNPDSTPQSNQNP